MEKQKNPAQIKTMSNKKIIFSAVAISTAIAIMLSLTSFGINWLLLNDQDLDLQRKITSNQTKINQAQKDLTELENSIDGMKEAELLSAIKEDSQTNVLEESNEQNSDPTVTWQSYTDEKYSYSVKVPEDWFILSNDAYQYDFVKDFSTENVDRADKLSAENGVWLNIRVEDDRGSLLESIANRTPYSPIGAQIETRKELRLSGYNALDQIESYKSATGTNDGYTRAIYVINTDNNKLYMMGFTTPSRKDLLTSQAIDLIIESLSLN